jgi:hypothetical protein
MDLAWWRDLVIVLAGAAVTLATVVFTILAVVIVFVLFKRVKKILAVADNTLGHVDEMAKLMKEEIVKPLVNIASIVRGVSDFVTSLKEGFLRGRSPQGGSPMTGQG